MEKAKRKIKDFLTSKQDAHKDVFYIKFDNENQIREFNKVIGIGIDLNIRPISAGEIGLFINKKSYEYARFMYLYDENDWVFDYWCADFDISLEIGIEIEMIHKTNIIFYWSDLNYKNDKKQRVYISGKITNEPNYIELFEQAENFISEKYPDKVVINPTKINNMLPNDCSWDEYMSVDYELVRLSDEIYMLKNWKDSRGATKEREWAIRFGLKITYQE